MTWCASLTRESGFICDQSWPYWLSRPKFPIENTHSVRPPVTSSSVASAWTTSVGSRSPIGVRLGPKRIFFVLSAACANRTHMSLCQVSSTEYTAW
jgi:hypothetical protein